MPATGTELLKHICDYQALIGRKVVLRARLDAGEAARLAALEELLAASGVGRSDTQPQRKHERLAVTLQATLDVGDRSAPVLLQNIGGGGVLVTTHGVMPPLHTGDRTLVTVKDSANKRAFLFPARVAWISGGAIGLAFTGIPRQVATSGTFAVVNGS